MEKWRNDLLNEATVRRDDAIRRFRKEAREKVEKADKVYAFVTEIIENLREEPDSIFGDTSIFIRTENHELVHDVSKALAIQLDRSAEADGFNFKGKVRDVYIDVYGMKELPHCKIVPHKRMKEVTEFEVVCNGKKIATDDPRLTRIPPR